MDDENRLREVDWRIVEALTPQGDTARRIAGRALHDQQQESRLTQRLMTVPVVALLALLLAAAFQARTSRFSPANSPPSLAITGQGDTITIQSSDGRRWFLAPAVPEPSPGNYIIAVASREP